MYLRIWFSILLFGMLTACPEPKSIDPSQVDEPKEEEVSYGNEGEPCWDNGACNPGLLCEDGICVPPGVYDSGIDPDGNTDGSSDGNADGSADSTGGDVDAGPPLEPVGWGETCGNFIFPGPPCEEGLICGLLTTVCEEECETPGQCTNCCPISGTGYCEGGFVTNFCQWENGVGPPDEPDAGEPEVSDAGDVVVPDAGDVVVSDAGDVAVSDAGDVIVSDAGDVVVPDAGDVALPDAGEPATVDAGATDGLDAGETVLPDAGAGVVSDAGSSLAACLLADEISCLLNECYLTLGHRTCVFEDLQAMAYSCETCQAELALYTLMCEQGYAHSLEEIQLGVSCVADDNVPNNVDAGWDAGWGPVSCQTGEILQYQNGNQTVCVDGLWEPLCQEDVCLETWQLCQEDLIHANFNDCDAPDNVTNTGCAGAAAFTTGREADGPIIYHATYGFDEDSSECMTGNAYIVELDFADLDGDAHSEMTSDAWLNFLWSDQQVVVDYTTLPLTFAESSSGFFGSVTATICRINPDEEIAVQWADTLDNKSNVVCVALDYDNDGISDIDDTDDDDDGVIDIYDECPKGILGGEGVGFHPKDYDNDGCQDAEEDTDDDNDGIEDSLDPCRLSLGISSEDLNNDGCKEEDVACDENDNCMYLVSGLTWQLCPVGTSVYVNPYWYPDHTPVTCQDNDTEELMLWQDAIDYCEALNYGGHEDWVLPQIETLRTLIKGCPNNEAEGICPIEHGCSWSTTFDDNACGSGSGVTQCDACTFEDGPAENHCYCSDVLESAGGGKDEYWSSSRQSSQTAYVVYFMNAFVANRYTSNASSQNESHVRCVRDPTGSDVLDAGP